MTATDELRRLLDEHGVEWGNIRNDGSESDYLTEWQFENNQGKAIAIEWAVGSGLSVEIHRYHLTPEQVIAATLGTGTCKPREVRSRFSKTQECVTYHCECGHELGGYMTAELPFPHTYNEDKLPNYCPNCGRRIEQ